jgi:hypothetical protein
MALDFRIKRATSAQASTCTLQDGELLHVTSATPTSNQLYIGTGTGKVELQRKDHTHAYEVKNTNYITHMANISNPHAVTKSQLGIPNFPNSSYKLVSNNLLDVGYDLTQLKTNLGLGNIVNYSSSNISTSNNPGANKLICIQANKKLPVCDGSNLVGYVSDSNLYYNGRLNLMTFGENFDSFYFDGTYHGGRAAYPTCTNMDRLAEVSNNVIIHNDRDAAGTNDRQVSAGIRGMTGTDATLPMNVKYYLRYNIAAETSDASNRIWIRLNNHLRINNAKYLYISFYMRYGAVLPNFSVNLIKFDGLYANTPVSGGTSTITFNPSNKIEVTSGSVSTWYKQEYLFDATQLGLDGTQLYLRINPNIGTGAVSNLDLTNIQSYLTNYGNLGSVTPTQQTETMTRQYSLLLERESQFYYSGLATENNILVGLGVSSSTTNADIYMVPFSHFDINGNTKVQAINKNMADTVYTSINNFATTPAKIAGTSNTGDKIKGIATAGNDAYKSNWLQITTGATQVTGNIVGLSWSTAAATLYSISSTR